MKSKPLPPLSYLQECFILDDTSPSGLRWKLRPKEHFAVGRAAQINSQYANKPAGHMFIHPTTGKAYWRVYVSGSSFASHRIVYSLATKMLVSHELEVDHINNVGTDNSISNLRLSSTEQNQANRVTQKNNTSGYKGVTWHGKAKAWRYEVMVNGKCHRGFAPTPDVASKHAQELREKLHKEFANHG